MARPRSFQQVDVFTAQPFLGNPVAVVLDSIGLSTEQMQAFTDWTNLSEATFVGPPTDPGADYALRIFCPGRELPFAGHPTLGSCHAWLAAGGAPRSGGDLIVQECGAGLVRIRRDGSTLAFAAPPLLRGGPQSERDVDLLVRGLGLAPSDVVAHQWCDNGPPWQAVLLRSAELVRSIRPDTQVIDGLFVGVVGPEAAGSDTDFEVRAFFPKGEGMAEDPVTGSLNAALAQWLITEDRAPHDYVAAQGSSVGRAGRVHVQRIGDDVWIGGACTTVIDGVVSI